MSGHNLYLVGSVPLGNAEEVFTTVSTALGPRLKRISDGETGERSTWLGWLAPAFSKSPVLEPSDDIWRVHEAASRHLLYRLKKGARLEDFHIDNLFYADIAKESYAVFKRLRDRGIIPAGTRFQITFAPGHSAVRSHVVEELIPAIEPIYNEAIGREIDKIAAALPHRDLAIQFDVASAVFERLQRQRTGAYGKTKDEMEARFTELLAKLADRVPADIELLFHFCYGDNNHRHSVEPTDMTDLVDMANRLTRAIKRPINFIHMPVPRDRSDDAYFAPLARLALRPETEIALGLVHLTGGIEGIKRRLATANKYLRGYVIATECGFGRRKPETIPELLRLHAVAAELD